MPDFIKNLPKLIKEILPLAVTALAGLFCVRFLALVLNLETQLGELWRPRLEEPEWGGWLIAAVVVSAFYYLQRGFSQVSQELQKRFLAYQASAYLTLGLFNNNVANRNYLYQLFDSRLDQEGLISLLTMDFLFQAPGIFWGLCFMAISLMAARKMQKTSFLPWLWCLPFLFFNYFQNNLIVVFFVSTTLAGLAAGWNKCRQSAAGIFALQGAILGAMIIWLGDNQIIYRASWLSAVVLLPVCWLPGFWLIRSCDRYDSIAASRMAWLVPVFSGGLLSQVLFNAPLGKSLFNFWFIFASFSHAAGTLTFLILAVTLSLIAGAARKSLMKPVFLAAITTISVIYMIDAVLLYRNGMHLSFAALSWVWSLANPASLLKTAGAMIDLRIILFTLALPACIFVCHHAGRSGSGVRCGRFSATIAYLAVCSQLSFIGYLAVTDLPLILRDPAGNFLASVPLPDFMAPPRPAFTELKRTMEELKIPLLPAKAQLENKRHTENRPNIILVTLESTANSYLSLFGYDQQTWPELEKLKNRMEIFPFIFAGFPESSNADFSIMSGLYPPDYLFLRQAPEFKHPILVDRLNKEGYTSSMFFSGFIGDTGLSFFYKPRGFARLYDAMSLPGITSDDGWVWGVKENVMIDRIGSLLYQSASQSAQPFFIYYRMIFPHSPFDKISDEPPHFPEDDYFRNSWLGRYKNLLLYQDKQLASLIKMVDKSDMASNTIILLIGDHGTMLGENGVHGHGWNLAPHLINVPLVIIYPKNTEFRVNPNPGSQADIVPTIFDLAGIEPGQEYFMQGRSLLSHEPASKTIYLSSLVHRALVEDGHYFLFPIENSPDAMVFRLDLKGSRPVFNQLFSWQPEDLIARYKRLRRFQRSQTIFLKHIESYRNEMLQK